MEKEFESLEYLVKLNGGVENSVNTGQQLLFVQGNEHLINVNKPTQYVTLAENTKEFESVACPSFDISQHPIYFQLNNSSELIPVSVNTIPTVEPSNVFENTYLLPNLTVEMIGPENVASNKQTEIPYTANLKGPSENMDVDADKLLGGYAEITLSDEQYEILKQKGWILLELKDKVFLLESSGLHEITNDHELVTKLRHEASQIGDKHSQTLGCPMKVVMIPENENVNTHIVATREACDQTEPMEIINKKETDLPVSEQIPHQITQGSTVMEIPHQITHDSTVMEIPAAPFKLEQESEVLTEDSNEIAQTNEKPHKIHFKTQHLLKDIPKEIVLGKGVNGKKLIARLVKGNGFFKHSMKINKNLKSEVGRDRNINDKQFAKLVQQVLLGTAENCRMEDVASVETVMSQMFRVPDLRRDLHKNKVIVTKTIREENEDGLIGKQSDPAVVTGRFIMNGSEGGFVHIPDMLLQHMKSSELEKYDQNYDSEKEKIETAITEEDMFLHVNITETKDTNNISRVSVMVNKRYLSLSQVYNMKSKHINAVYACTACAKVFKSEEKLENHQEYQCSEVPVLPADNTHNYTIVKTPNKINVYMCNVCKVKFVKRKECREHLRTHYSKTNYEVTTDVSYLASNAKQTQVYKCKMCQNVYFHSSSLTKHILAKHIKPK